jgi:hypothetical protein
MYGVWGLSLVGEALFIWHHFLTGLTGMLDGVIFSCTRACYLLDGLVDSLDQARVTGCFNVIAEALHGAHRVVV